MKRYLLPILLTLIGITNVYSQSISDTSAIVLPVDSIGTYIVNPGQTLSISSNVIVMLRPGTHFKDGSNVHVHINDESSNQQNLAKTGDEQKQISETLEQVTQKNQTSSSTTYLSTYPNPAQSSVNIDLGNAFQGYKLRLVDIKGTIIEEKKANAAIEHFDVGNLPNGIYFIHIKDSSRTKIAKIIKN